MIIILFVYQNVTYRLQLQAAYIYPPTRRRIRCTVARKAAGRARDSEQLRFFGSLIAHRGLRRAVPPVWIEQTIGRQPRARGHRLPTAPRGISSPHSRSGRM
jgi:hypothetical protein